MPVSHKGHKHRKINGVEIDEDCGVEPNSGARKPEAEHKHEEGVG